jgi:alpha-glucosidase (family GH31 glycosyl hydrolase)
MFSATLKLTTIFFTIILIASIGADDKLAGEYIVEPVRLNEAPYAQWAHYHWVWLSKPSETQESLVDLVNDYLARSIPVGAVNVDSGWPERYQNFKWNAKNFPNPAEMVEYFHSIDVKVITWITSMVNNDSTNYEEAKKNGYLLNEGKLIKWWRGHGALFDYSNPQGLDWWHKVTF